MKRHTVAVILLLFLTGATLAAAPAPFETFRVKTTNTPTAQIAGILLRAAAPVQGTLFLCHGYGTSKETYFGYDWLRTSLHWNLVLFDFREHGESTHDGHLCSLGYHEKDDLEAVIDYANSTHLAGPYAAYGRSMGAAVALECASTDHRLVGVFAQSPFRNALVASEQFPSLKFGFDLPSVYRLSPTFSANLRSVDIPKAVAQRNDLRICILAGEHDCFPIADQRAILTASASPDSMKSMYIARGFAHRGLWAWKGDDTTPGHDELVRTFLAQCHDTAQPLPKIPVSTSEIHRVMHTLSVRITHPLYQHISKRVFISSSVCAIFLMLVTIRWRRSRVA